jgi:hypothetical protein
MEVADEIQGRPEAEDVVQLLDMGGAELLGDTGDHVAGLVARARLGVDGHLCGQLAIADPAIVIAVGAMVGVDGQVRATIDGPSRRVAHADAGSIFAAVLEVFHQPAAHVRRRR